MRKAAWMVTLLIFIFASMGSASAASSKIGVIDMMKVLRDSKGAKEARSMFLMDIESKKGVLKTKEKEVRGMEQALRSGKKNLTAEALREENEKIARAVKDLKRLRDDMEEELKKKEGELRRKLMKEIERVVQEFLIKQKYAVVLEKKTVVAMDDAIDITEDIITLYDARQR